MTDPHDGPGIWQRVRARPALFGGLATAALAGVVLVLWWFQPQALLFDRVVDEEFPGAPEPTADPEPTSTDRDLDEIATTDGEAMDGEAADGETRQQADDPAAERDEAADAPEPDEADAPTGPRALLAGGFESRNRYTVTGGATVYELEDGSRTLRLEPFESTNGPDLFVYLTAADHADDDAALDADFIDLGELRGNIGSQNYVIGEDVDLDTYDTVVIWCRRFSVSFGAADLAPANA